MSDSGTPVWARRTERGWLLTVRVQPAAARSAVAGVIGDALKIRVATPASEGRANAELTRLIADCLHVRQRSVRIAQGDKGRTKLVEVDGHPDLVGLEPPPRR
ncbi:MAG: DUF167 domain-containing protein [Acidimicrobiia bacterium]|nr:DUF167 domain-containing protein [Acidimicrobiia bacterium]